MGVGVEMEVEDTGMSCGGAIKGASHTWLRAARGGEEGAEGLSRESHQPAQTHPKPGLGPRCCSERHPVVCAPVQSGATGRRRVHLVEGALWLWIETHRVDSRHRTGISERGILLAAHLPEQSSAQS